MTILKYIILGYIAFKVLYTLIGISYEWITKQKVKGFTLNLIASVILFLLNLTLPYQIFLNFKRRKIGNVLDELVLYELNKASSRDQTGNVIHYTILNKYLIDANGYKFGDKDETVSGVLGINEVLHYIENKKIGKWLVATLNDIETNHCKISIDRTNYTICSVGNQFTKGLKIDTITPQVGTKLYLTDGNTPATPGNLSSFDVQGIVDFNTNGIKWVRFIYRENNSDLYTKVWEVNPVTGVIVSLSSYKCNP